MIQILCDKNFRFKKNIGNESSIESNNESTLNDIDHKPKIKIEKDTTIEKQQKKKSKSCDQSCCPDHHQNNQKTMKNKIEMNTSFDDQPHSCCPDHHKIRFNNQTSTLQISPSFNLKSNQKSTPNNCAYTNRPKQSMFSPQQHSSTQTAKSQLDVKVDIECQNDSDNETFHSL